MAKTNEAFLNTGASPKTAADTRQRLDQKLENKIKPAAVLYTHSHYTDGTDACLDEGAEIWGHEHLDKHRRADTAVSSKESAEFVLGQQSFSHRDNTDAAFESVLARPSLP